MKKLQKIPDAALNTTIAIHERLQSYKQVAGTQ